MEMLMRDIEILIIANDTLTVDVIKSDWTVHKKVTVVHRITEGIELFMGRRFDLVISESSLFANNLSAIDCYEIYRKMYRKSPYILLFSSNHESESLFIKRPGLPNDPYLEYFTKPFSPRYLGVTAEQLISEISIVIEKQETTPNLQVPIDTGPYRYRSL